MMLSQTATKRSTALEHALDIRKFEIELYWKRANYFWTFIAGAFAGYAAVQTVRDRDLATDLSVILACLGTVLSVGWFLANKGSKQWQENWENHVDLLEDEIVGPLYKTILRRPPARGVINKIKRAAAGPGNFSVSKINQIISLFVTALWVVLLCRALPPISIHASPDWLYVTCIATSLAACALLFWLGKTEDVNHGPEAWRRVTSISDKAQSEDPPGTESTDK